MLLRWFLISPLSYQSSYLIFLLWKQTLGHCLPFSEQLIGILSNAKVLILLVIYRSKTQTHVDTKCF